MFGEKSLILRRWLNYLGFGFKLKEFWIKIEVGRSFNGGILMNIWFIESF